MNLLQQATARAIVNIFETGRILGDYSAVAVLKGDSGHLSYGRSQAALGSGTLFELLDSYCRQPNAKFAPQLLPALPRFQQKDVTLDSDIAIKQVLKEAGQDPVMRTVQDQFFNRRYLAPACSAAEALGILEPLGQTVVYDSFIQGGWGKLSARMPPPVAGKQRDWVRGYVNLRASWLKAGKPPLPTTAYRMTSLLGLMNAGNWDLDLPLQVHGITLSREALAGDIPGSGPMDAARVLQLTSPYLRGEDVRALQQKLASQGLPANVDGVYGPFTAQLVSQWQKSRQPALVENGVGAMTRASLGL